MSNQWRNKENIPSNHIVCNHLLRISFWRLNAHKSKETIHIPVFYRGLREAHERHTSSFVNLLIRLTAWHCYGSRTKTFNENYTLPDSDKHGIIEVIVISEIPKVLLLQLVEFAYIMWISHGSVARSDISTQKLEVKWNGIQHGRGLCERLG